jgi:hypothetical protein
MLVNKTLCESVFSPSTCEAGNAKLVVIDRVSIAVCVNDDHAVIEKLIRSAGVDINRSVSAIVTRIA